jgi:hypothetical protein
MPFPLDPNCPGRVNRFTGHVRSDACLTRIEEISEGMIQAEVNAILTVESRDFMLIGPAAGEKLRQMVYGK